MVDVWAEAREREDYDGRREAVKNREFAFARAR